MKNVIFFFLIELLLSQKSAYKDFQSYMSIVGGRILDIHFFQDFTFENDIKKIVLSKVSKNIPREPQQNSAFKAAHQLSY